MKDRIIGLLWDVVIYSIIVLSFVYYLPWALGTHEVCGEVSPWHYVLFYWIHTLTLAVVSFDIYRKCREFIYYKFETDEEGVTTITSR